MLLQCGLNSLQGQGGGSLVQAGRSFGGIWALGLCALSMSVSCTSRWLQRGMHCSCSSLVRGRTPCQRQAQIFEEHNVKARGVGRPLPCGTCLVTPDQILQLSCRTA